MFLRNDHIAHPPAVASLQIKKVTFTVLIAYVLVNQSHNGIASNKNAGGAACQFGMSQSPIGNQTESMVARLKMQHVVNPEFCC
jgi:hypothetical protein